MDEVKKGCVVVKRGLAISVFGLILGLVSANPLHSCVGRLLVVAVTNSTDQVIMGQMLSILINERTGTTVDIVQPGDLEACREAVLKAKADIYIDYIGNGLASVGGSHESSEPQELYTLVSQSFLENFKMVWLKPFGFDGPLSLEDSPQNAKGTLAAPVTTKDVLQRFPVLDRLINKLGGRIDNKMIDELRKNVDNQDMPGVAREFLKAHQLI
jgi:osmoprotectant transport system substrate-binding protein